MWLNFKTTKKSSLNSKECHKQRINTKSGLKKTEVTSIGLRSCRDQKKVTKKNNKNQDVLPPEITELRLKRRKA